jgi:hypothetical protein
MKEEYTTIEFKSEGFDEAYIRYLERVLKDRTLMMWWAFLGWVLTAVLNIMEII